MVLGDNATIINLQLRELTPEERSEKHSVKITSRKKLKGKWCECGNPSKESIYKEDRSCKCGTRKHHYHCEDCGGITQVG